jgi:hypothetical protein
LCCHLGKLSIPLKLQGATSAPKARSEKGFNQQAPTPNTEVIDNDMDGAGRKDEGVLNVW